jgi:hypothetical protein
MWNNKKNIEGRHLEKYTIKLHKAMAVPSSKYAREN